MSKVDLDEEFVWKDSYFKKLSLFICQSCFDDLPELDLEPNVEYSILFPTYINSKMDYRSYNYTGFSYEDDNGKEYKPATDHLLSEVISIWYSEARIKKNWYCIDHHFLEGLSIDNEAKTIRISLGS